MFYICVMRFEKPICICYFLLTFILICKCAAMCMYNHMHLQARTAHVSLSPNGAAHSPPPPLFPRVFFHIWHRVSHSKLDSSSLHLVLCITLMVIGTANVQSGCFLVIRQPGTKFFKHDLGKEFLQSKEEQKFQFHKTQLF